MVSTEEISNELKALVSKCGGDPRAFLSTDETPATKRLLDLGYLEDYEVDYSLQASFRLSEKALMLVDM